MLCSGQDLVIILPVRRQVGRERELDIEVLGWRRVVAVCLNNLDGPL